MRDSRVWPWVAGAVSVLALLVVGRAVMLARQAGAEPSGVRYATGVVERGGIRVTVTGTGTAAFAERQAVFPEVDGTVAAVPVRVGERVRKGQVLVALANDDMIPAAEVAAPATGRVTGVRFKEGDLVQKGAVLAEVVDGSPEFVGQVAARERDRVRPGQTATIVVDGSWDTELAGSVVSVGGEAVAGQYEVRIGVVETGPWRAGMTGPATATVRAEGGEALLRGVLSWVTRQAAVAPMAGRIDRLDVAEGQAVRAGERLARIANASWSPEELADKLALRAPTDGVVVALNVQVGDRLAAGARSGTDAGLEPVAVATGDVLVTAAVDEMDVARVQAGQKAEVTFPSLPGRVYAGTVEQVALEGRSQNGVTTYDVRVRLEAPEGVRAGMTAGVSILVAAKEDALLVPVEAVTETAQGPVVRVLDGAAPRPVPVRLGLRNDRVAEVVSGLRPGERVVLAEFDPSTSVQGAGPRPGGFGPGGIPAGPFLGRPGGSGRPGGGAGGGAH